LLSLVSIGLLLKRDPGETDFAVPDEGTPSIGIPDPAVQGYSLHEALRTRQFWAVCMINLAVVFCMLSVMVHIVPHAQDLGASSSRAAGVMATIGGVSIVGRFVSGVSVDRFGSKAIMKVCFVLLISGLLWLQLAGEVWKLYLFALVYGIAHGGYFTAVSPVVAEYFGLYAHGVLFGIVVFCGTVGGSVGPFLTGYIFDITAGYGSAFWLLTLASVLGLLMLMSLKPVVSKV
jgi:MFS family permease